MAINLLELTNVSSPVIDSVYNNSKPKAVSDSNDFDLAFQAAMNMVNETNDYSNAAESAEIQFALGQQENTHDLLVAQEKSNVALQFTVAVRDKVLEAYREIMQMQM